MPVSGLVHVVLVVPGSIRTSVSASPCHSHCSHAWAIIQPLLCHTLQVGLRKHSSRHPWGDERGVTLLAKGSDLRPSCVYPMLHPGGKSCG
eukprot:179834-Rhodomonas_salina.1